MDDQAHILVVDDNADGSVALAEVLSISGYRATIAGTGRRALALLDLNRFDAVVLDLGLPDVDGLEVLRAVRAQAHRPVAIVFSGFHRQQAEAEAVGCDRFVLKPALDDLLESLRVLLAARRDRIRAVPQVKKGA